MGVPDPPAEPMMLRYGHTRGISDFSSKAHESICFRRHTLLISTIEAVQDMDEQRDRDKRALACRTAS